MRLLYLHNGPRRASVAKLEERFAEAGFAVESKWAYGGEFPARLDNYAACFLSGSPHGAYDDVPWIHREHELIADLAERKIPTIGICFGSQIMGSALCGRDQVFRRASCDVGYTWLDLTPAAAADPLTAGLGARVSMFVWHNDEVRAAHPDMTILAGTAECPNHIWRYKDLPMWGIQGHPEVDAEQARHWFEEVRQRLEADGADVDRLKRDADDAIDAKSMLRNFMAYPRRNRGKQAEAKPREDEP